MQKYSNSKLMKSVKENYKNYQKDYLFGMDNTPTVQRVDDEEPFIYPENIEEFNRFKTTYPTSKTNTLIKIFMENFKDDNHIYDLIENEQSKE